MNRLIRLAHDAIAANEPCVLCTVVRLDGSGYGRPGSRLLLTESGQRHGYISGGCLEKDLCRRVWSATQTGPSLMAFDTRGNNVDAPKYNTGCEGVVHVLCQRITADDTRMIDVLQCANESTSNVRMLTVYRSGTPRYQAGDCWIEIDDYRDQPESQLALPTEVEQAWLNGKQNRPIRFQFDGQEIEAAIEILRPPRQLIVFGAGDDAIPVVQSAAALGWNVTVVGKRPELAKTGRFSPLTEAGSIDVICGDCASVACDLFIGRQTDTVVMTHDFEGDVRLLPVLLDSPSRFIGLLGPKGRLGSLVTRLYEAGRTLTDDDIDRLHSPIGLDIGATTPGEIATSILAELIAVQHGRGGGSLHQRTKPLHEPAPLTSIQARPGEVIA